MTKRLPEYATIRRPQLEAGLYSTAPIYDDFEKLKLANSLAFLQSEYGANSEMAKRSSQRQDPGSSARLN